MIIECSVCEKKKEGIKLLIRTTHKKINMTTTINESTCFDCLKLDSVIIVNHIYE